MIGAALDIRDGYHADAATLEEVGYSALWVMGGQLSSLAVLGEMHRATRAAKLGSAIIPLEVHDAASVARLYHGLGSDRLVLGLGSGRVPLARTHHYLDRLDALGVPESARMLAASGPRKLDLARKRTGGAVQLLVDQEYTATTRAGLGPRRRLVVSLPVVLDNDARRARDALRQLLGALSHVPGYQRHFARMGFTEQEVTTLSDGFVDRLTAWGDEDAVAARVRAYLDAGADQVVLTPQPGEGGPDSHTTLLRLAGLLPTP